MYKGFLISKTITGMVTFLLMTMAYAGSSLWTITPLTATTISVANTESKTIKYRVTNQSRKTHTLVLTSIPGINQLTTSGDCAHPFTLAYKESCTLNLQITGSALKGKVDNGPILCQQGNSLLCYQPNQADKLNITLVQSHLILTATPSAQAGVGTSYSQTNVASHGVLPYLYSVSTGTLPTGTTLNTATGTVSGIPTATAPFSYTIKVTDNNHTTAIATSSGTITGLIATVLPSSLNLGAGQTATFTTNITGGIAPFNYQWHSCTTSTCNSPTVISGATSSTYNPSTTTAGTYYYQVQITDSASVPATTTAIATLNILSATATPGTLTVDAGQSATFTANPTAGTAPYTYQWYSCTTVACSSPTMISGETSSTYSPTTVSAGTHYYQAQVTDAVSTTATTNAVTLTINTALSATATPGTLTVDAGQSATFTANPTAGTVPYTYQWYSCTTVACSSPTMISGETSSTYSPTTVSAGTHYYQTQVTDAVSTTATTNAVTLTINTALSATATPGTLTVDAGQSATFTANPTAGTVPYTYQWYSCATSACISVASISGATSSTYSPSTTSAGVYYYQAMVTDATSATATTNSTTLTVDNALSATATPSSLAVDAGQTATFTANPYAGTAPYSYQWYSCTTIACSSPTLISGETSSTYSPTTTPAGTYYYQAQVTDSAAVPETATTNAITLTIGNALSATATPGSLIADSGQSATFTAHPSGGTTPYSYQWYSCTTSTCISVASISGATSNTYSPSTATAGTYYYQAQVTDSATVPETVTTNEVTLTVDNALSATATPSSLTIGLGQTSTFTANPVAGTPPYSYQWYSCTTSDCSVPTLIGGATNSTYSPSISATGVYYYQVIVTDSATIPSTATTTSATLTVRPQYAYVADYGRASIWQCPMNATGDFSGGCTLLVNSTSPGFRRPWEIVFATFSSTLYSYVADVSANLWQCPMTATGSISGGACISLNSSFSGINAVAFGTFSGTTYGYVTVEASLLKQCPMNATGGFSSACTVLSNSTSPGFSSTYGVTLATFSGAVYAYIADNSKRIWQCPMNNTTGGFSGGCTALTNSTSPGFSATFQITFATFSGTTYGYVSANHAIWQCPMTATGGFSGGCTQLTNSTSPGFSSADLVTFATFSGTTYAYIGDFAARIWKCPMNNTTGGFSGGCTALTNSTSPGFGNILSAAFATL